MSVQALSWVFDFSESTLAARHVLLSIANHAKANGTGAWPSVKRIAKEARVHERTVQRCLDELIELDELKVQWEKGPHGTNLYTLKKMVATLKSGGQDVTPPTVEDEEIDEIHEAGCPKNVDRMSPEPSLKQPSYEQPSKAEPSENIKPCHVCGSTEIHSHPYEKKF